jgi:hypothetical protein
MDPILAATKVLEQHRLMLSGKCECGTVLPKGERSAIAGHLAVVLYHAGLLRKAL